MSADEQYPEFDWRVYADATLAGLSVLIPIPLVDWAFETFFKRRIPRSIVSRRDRDVDRRVVGYLGSGSWSWYGCLLWPLKLIVEFLKRTFRTVLYFLTIKAATDGLSYYWHRAFLIDYAVRKGDLDQTPSAWQSVIVIEQLLDQTNTSPMQGMATRVIQSARHVLRTLLRWARRQEEDEVIRAARDQLQDHWADIAGHLRSIGREYDQLIEERSTREPAT